MMVNFTGYDDGLEPVTIFISQAGLWYFDPGRKEQVSTYPTILIPHIPEEYNGSSELGVVQPMAACRKLLPPVVPGAAQYFVNEKQYDAILRLRQRRARIAARRENGNLNTKRCPPRGPDGRFCGIKDDQEVTSGVSQAPISIRAVDLYRGFVATNDDEENTGEVAYDSILNLEAPDCTSLLRVMMGDRYNGEVSEQFDNVACLLAPDFANLLTVMNNASYDEALDDGYYDVEKVMLKLEGW